MSKYSTNKNNGYVIIDVVASIVIILLMVKSISSLSKVVTNINKSSKEYAIAEELVLELYTEYLKGEEIKDKERDNVKVRVEEESTNNYSKMVVKIYKDEEKIQKFYIYK